ncbi:hemocytin-like isoform X2 [Microplitis mediator]|uniref:hemocytin-like isoform X2 n=1 Tax=Microplitis mediator TaxID=375433 RepID=UPI0025576681|nr:hemocytin-like isoform X2 [Microplitis mediator]
MHFCTHIFFIFVIVIINGPYSVHSQLKEPLHELKSPSYASNQNSYGDTSKKLSQNTNYGDCNNISLNLINGKIKCSRDNCIAQCNEGYQFPKGATQLLFECYKGTWQIDGVQTNFVPGCKAICVPECQNGGYCFAPHQCRCPKDFMGSQCQFYNEICESLPQVPNARISCDSKTCTVACSNEFVFPDGTTIARLFCQNGAWVPSNPEWVSLPNCKPSCIPPCQNKGICVNNNVCQCPLKYRGAQCQYPVSVCDSTKLAFNGNLKCKGNADMMSCTISCPDSSKFTFQPAKEYICYYDKGIFEPQHIPECNTFYDEGTNQHEGPSNYMSHGQYPSKSVYPSSRGYGSESEKKSLENNLETKQINPQPKTCFTWGGIHYKTFDGAIYSFESNCAHTLVQDIKLETFTITTQNSLGCKNEGVCHRVIKIFLSDNEYILTLNDKKSPTLKSINKTLPIPVRLPGIEVEMSSHFVLVFLNSVGANLKWDGNLFVQIQLSELLWDKTAGLCGRMNGDINDDKTTRDNKRPQNIAVFAAAWKILSLGETCDENINAQHACENAKNLTQNATDFCLNLFSDDKFKMCSEVIDLTVLQQNCQWDYCACKLTDRKKCSCNTKGIYIRQCYHDRMIRSLDWRTNDTCPMECPDGKIYKACGPKSQATCTADFIVKSLDDANCEEGCFCPENTVLHDEKCTTKEKCPCTLRGKLFQPGESVSKDCNTCTCSSGKWICTEVICSARCAVIGDPHYTTFDGKNYDFMGKCNYYLVKGDDYSIETQNVQCSGAITESVGFSNSAYGTPSCTKSVTIRIGTIVIKLKQNLQVLINGEDITTLPIQAAGAKIRFASNLFVVVDVENGLQVWWDGVSSVFVKAPPEFRGKTKGLCGTFNANQKDDFLTPAGDIEQSDAAFANKWKTDEVCSNVAMKEPQHPCNTNPERLHDAEKYCSELQGDIFFSCNWYVDSEPFYEDCKYDMCACAGDIKQCMSPTFAAYARECAIAGVKILWRNEMEGFQIQCPEGQEYQICGSSCARSCKDISFNLNCQEECVEGCNCPIGQTLNTRGECIPIGECPCKYNELEYNAGYREIRPETLGEKLCTCASGTWICNPATQEEIQIYPLAGSFKTVCDASKNFETTECEPVQPQTCHNMHAHIEYTPAVCHPGCVCKKRYVLDTISQTCVEKKKCPCYHSGISYREGFSIQQDCNTCECSNGKWNCTDRICSRVCSVWGDSHYTTFDEKTYDFQGTCDYVLAKGSLNDDETFEISIQNVPCGNNEVSCSKSVTLTVGSSNNQESITLAQGKMLPDNSFERITIRKSGLFIFLDVPDLGLVLQWDQGTRVYVKLNPNWKGYTSGLCGDYNDNAEDDFKTPSGGIPEVSARLFGDSWKKDNYCPEPLEVMDTCVKHPERKIWSVEKCGVLQSSVFKICHTELDPTSYIQRCIFDTCACIEGDDCHCLCTALSSYAHECNRRGLPVKWRCPGLCEIQCADEFRYSPCMSTCPHETCDNLATFHDGKHLCTQDTCVEGCIPKPCPEDHIYKNNSFLECIPRSMCKPLCLEIQGKLYYEGDTIRGDECQTCFCSHGKIVCNGAPCSELKSEPIIIPGTETKIELFNISSPTTTTTTTTTTTNKVTTITTHITTTVYSGSCDKNNEYHPDPRNCQLFYHCAPATSGLEWYESTCGPGTLYNPKNKICDWPTTVIAVRPECGNITVSETTGRCNEGEHWDVCAINCNRVCQYYRHVLVQQNYCTLNNNCVPGCVNDKNVCPSHKYWRDLYTCVDISDCPCKTYSGNQIKPGGIFKESDCEVCQCLSNYYTCDKSACLTSLTNSVNVNLTRTNQTLTENYQVIPINQQIIITTSTVSPANPCISENYISIFENDINTKVIFNASSTTDPNHKPEYSKLFTSDTMTNNSLKNWQPKYMDSEQWLEIILPRLEPLYGIIMQGSIDEKKYVTSYKVLYSQDEKTFSYIMDSTHKNPQLFQGKIDSTVPVKQFFQEPIEAKIIKINPQTWHHGIAIKVDLLGCNEHFDITNLRTNTSIITNNSSIVHEVIVTKPICDDTMGLNNGLMKEQQITASSTLDKIFPNVQLSSSGIWRPLLDNPTQFIEFDFLQSVNLTGIETKGADNIWTTAYKIFYGKDDQCKNAVVDSNGNEKLFLGNFDDKTTKINYFHKPIHARYLRIQPIKWHEHVGLKVEIHGCFIPYPEIEIEELPQSEQTIKSNCNVCPGIFQDLTLNECTCNKSLWWTGETCALRQDCPCVVNGMIYSAGTSYETKNCQQCQCAINGVSECKPKVCNPCNKPDLQSVVTELCGCICKPCPPGMRLCPTSNICIKEADWCNGVKDCPDDESNCKTSLSFSNSYAQSHIITKTTTFTVVRCELPTCPPGYKLIPMQKSSPQNMSDSSKVDDENVQIDTRSNFPPPKSPTKNENPMKEENKFKPFEFECQQFLCVSVQHIMVSEEQQMVIKCPEVECPPKYKLIYEPSSLYDRAVCPSFTCKPPPPKEVICNVTGRSFNTFDNLEYKYDICNHILVREMYDNSWYIMLKKLCYRQQFCSQALGIVTDNDVITLYSNMSVSINNNTFMPEQVTNLRGKGGTFVIIQIGNSLNFVSNKYGFWLTWDQNSNVKISITTKLINHVDGLCGYYDNKIENDRQNPDGSQAITSEDFGDSWLVDGASKCENEKYHKQLLEEAQKICNATKDKSFTVCENVLELNKYISRCIETTCNCLNENITYEQCRCRTLESFVSECQAADRNVDLSSWRGIQNCLINCPSPLVYKDCFRRKCEVTCDNLQEIDPCPLTDGFCYSGCFCPEGTVRKGNDCISPTECRDCVCNGFGYSSFTDFNNRGFSFPGNCTYILSQDIVKNKVDEHTYRVLIKNVPCDKRICLEALIILYKDHLVRIERDLNFQNFTLLLDNELIQVPYKNFWISFTKKLNNDIKILIPAIQLELTGYHQSFGFTVRIPSRIFGNAIEGLCGSCSIIQENGFKKSNNELTENVEEFGLSWLATGIPQVGLVSADECTHQPIKQCDYSIFASNNSCLILTNENTFGKCHSVIDPTPFVKSCQDTLCVGGNVCGDIEAYARECGLCINWRASDLCPLKCSENLKYQACGPSCTDTCDTVRKNETRKCTSDFAEGCFCPKDHVLNNGTCIPKNKCFICDEQGHLEGDVWQPDPCITCSCKNQIINCNETKCSTLETVCLENYTLLKVPGTEKECCPKYRCIPTPDKNVTCENKPQQPNCGYGQIIKITKGNDGCQTFSCQCIPAEECPSPDITSLADKEKLLQPGYAEVINQTGCCLQNFVVCKPETCPPPSKCPKYYNNAVKTIPGVCCPIHKCELPQDKCLYSNDNQTVEIIAVEIGKTWKKSLCEDCVCEKSIDKFPKSVCAKIQCPTINDHSDINNYELVEVPLKDQCCSKIERVACKHIGKIYNVGQTWQSNPNDTCEMIKCDNETNSGIQKKIIKQECKISCNRGFEYKPSENKNITCCGECVPVACVVNGSLKIINEKWHSEDLCTNYECLSDKGNLRVKESVTSCEKLESSEEEKYKIKKQKITGQCCLKYDRVGCRSENNVYLPGMTWTNAKNSCITEQCSNKTGKLELTQIVQNCVEDCQLGWEYRQPKTGHCCGKCEQTYCMDNGVLHKINATWRSKDKCTTYTCRFNNNQLIVNSSTQQCPDVSYCKSVRLHDSGCCNVCANEKESVVLEFGNNTILGQCDVTTIDKNKTFEIITVKYPNHGVCKNKELIKGFAQCHGTCEMPVRFDPVSSRQLNECKCCQSIGKMQLITVNLICDDKTKIPQKVFVPTKCSCQACNSYFSTKKKPIHVKSAKG